MGEHGLWKFYKTAVKYALRKSYDHRNLRLSTTLLHENKQTNKLIRMLGNFVKFVLKTF